MKHLVLLADDSSTIQRLVTQTFSDSKVEIVCVSNGDAAIRKFEELQPELVLSDIYMPGRNGYEVCSYIRKHAELAETPVILLAGAFDAFDEKTAVDIGATNHVRKPFEPQALVDLVLSLLPEKPRKRATSDVSAAPSEPVSVPAPAVAAAPALERAPEIIEPKAEPPAPAPAVAAAAARPEVSNIPPATAAPTVLVETLTPVTPTVAKTPAAPVSPPAVAGDSADDNTDLLGLAELFPPPAPRPMSDEELERVADRVIQKLSVQVVESVAWDVVPDIATEVLREELKKQS